MVKKEESFPRWFYRVVFLKKRKKGDKKRAKFEIKTLKKFFSNVIIGAAAGAAVVVAFKVDSPTFSLQTWIKAAGNIFTIIIFVIFCFLLFRYFEIKTK